MVFRSNKSDEFPKCNQKEKVTLNHTDHTYIYVPYPTASDHFKRVKKNTLRPIK